MQPDSLRKSIEERLKARARRTGRSIGAVAREAVLKEIDALEDFVIASAQRRRLAAQRRDAPPSTLL